MLHVLIDLPGWSARWGNDDACLCVTLWIHRLERHPWRYFRDFPCRPGLCHVSRHVTLFHLFCQWFIDTVLLLNNTCQPTRVRTRPADNGVQSTNVHVCLHSVVLFVISYYPPQVDVLVSRGRHAPLPLASSNTFVRFHTDYRRRGEKGRKKRRKRRGQSQRKQAQQNKLYHGISW